MTHDRQRQAEQLTQALELSLPPIAVALCEAVPDGVPEFEGSVPAGCVFWQEAARRTFATSAGHHALCSIGIHTLNLSPAPASQPEELRASLEAMMGLDYVREEEVAAIPVLQREVKHALYGPLADFPAEPEAVLLFAHARQGLVLSEAIGRVDGGQPPAMGRPACAIVPRVLNQGLAAMSLGCCGARALTIKILLSFLFSFALSYHRGFSCLHLGVACRKHSVEIDCSDIIHDIKFDSN